ncbi:class I SAM-dependent methyltransferase [Mumia sp. DW29H23]|uniref:class I SAM-dependent methyltransferase n=1 Tax=Mumia sp. DW29H23 TaxID=3421241 RepID=UPI003D68DD7D
MPGRNPLEEYFRRNTGRQIHKWPHYFDVYDRHFQRFRGRPVTVLEFGVQYGGSLQMWQDYFGPQARFFGVDIDPRCRAWEDEQTTILIGDQADRGFLAEVAAITGTVDVLIEDGGHFPAQQIATFEELYPLMAPDGVFLIEDLHTSYWPSHEGRRGGPDTFMEYAKNLTDQLNAFHSREPGFEVDDFTRTTRSMHFYDSIIVFERGPVEPPRNKKTGLASWDPAEHAARAREQQVSQPHDLRGRISAIVPGPVHDAYWATRRRVRRAWRQARRRISRSR